MNLEKILMPGFSSRGGVYYYTDVPGDIIPSPNTAADDPRKWGRWRTSNFEFFKRELAKLSKQSVLVDVGAGQSHFRRLFEPFETVPIDFYPYPKVAVVCDFGKGLPLKDASADILVLSNVLEHMAQPLVLLQECRRILKPGGVLLGAVPFLIEVHQRPYDFYRYTDVALEKLLQESRFSRVEVEPVVSSWALFKNASERFFGDTIRYYRRRGPLGGGAAFAVRTCWLFFRMVFFMSGRHFFDRPGGSKDAALGYHFIAR